MTRGIQDKKKLKFFNKLFLAKTFLKRSASYISIFNTGMIIFIAIAQLKDMGFDINIGENVLLVYGVGTVLMFIAGYLDFRMGFDIIETGINARRNQYEMEVVTKVRKMEEMLNEMKTEKDELLSKKR